MAHTARKESEKKEYFDPPDVLEQKVETLAQWVKESSHFITFTVSRRIGIKLLLATLLDGLSATYVHGRYGWIINMYLKRRTVHAHHKTPNVPLYEMHVQE